MSDAEDAERGRDGPDGAGAPGTAERVGYAVAYFLLLGFSVGSAVREVTVTLFPSPAFGTASGVGSVATAAVAGLLSGVRRPPSPARVLAFSAASVLFRFALGALVGPSVGDLHGSDYVAADLGLTWLAALLFAAVVVFGVDWSGPRERLRRHLTGERGD